MRQAKDNEIIRLSMDIREGKTIKPYTGYDINIVNRSQMVDGMFTWADQVICGKNLTRYTINDRYRRMIWKDEYTQEPKVKDKIICLKNNWKQTSDKAEPLINGSIGHIAAMHNTPNNVIGVKSVIDFQVDQGGCFKDILMDWKMINKHESTITIENFKRIPIDLVPNQFAYGYAITCWKAQGSQWDNILFLAERVGNMNEKMYRRYLYTGCTRASKKLTLVLP